jgi:hypothetical protein
MNNLTIADLRRAIEIKEQIESLEATLSTLLDGGAVRSPGTGKTRRGRKAVAASAKVDSNGTPPIKGKRGRRRMSAAGRARIAAAARTRWKKAKASGKNSLAG